MIGLKSNPLEWSELLYELEDAKEHLTDLINSMESSGSIDDIEFKACIEHVYSHLNKTRIFTQLKD